MKKVLITGYTGFAGSHLADLLLETGGYEVFGLRRWRSRTENIEHLAGKVTEVEGDITDASRMREIISDIKPDFIFHLAAQSFVPTSWKEPDTTLTNNIRGQLNLLEAMRSSGHKCRIQIAGSSEEYGLVQPDEVPITEDNPLRPLSPYAVSKVTQDMLAWQYFKSYDLDVVRTRGFNHTGPRRGDVFVVSNFAKQVAMIEAGLQDPVILTGNLDATRDFTDVRDMVKGYLLCLEKGEPGAVYNLCSGREIKIGDMLDMLIELSPVEIERKLDPERMRPSDVMVLLGSAAKFHAATGWKPEIEFTKTLKDLLDYWRNRLATNA
ncbi:GDP-mannose 4,6-dehydratase [bacterium]|jgi:GDP-4-dehydro-6-deoxy-D-mannose reductase|nr:GDP-mannose 4,6-dehydratase [bacterium]